MQVVLALFALISVALAVKSELQYKNAFAAFMTQHGKVYADASESATRYNIFKVNLDFVENFNGTFKVAMNKFGDMSNEEFRAQFNGLAVPEGYLHDSSMYVRSVRSEQLPSSMDWRTKGAVTAVKNQQQCGSCWSFSTTGSMEGCHFLATNKLVSLSEKNLMDCSWNQGNMACNGGLMTSAMQYIKSNNGIDTEASYPYVPVSSHDCRYKVANRGAQIGSYTNVPSGSESDLQSTVAKGPVSVAIDASHSSFQFYSHGVYYEPACSSSRLDHGVLAIGWGVESGSDYWLVKNSWGADWGMQGFIKMARNRNNNCGIATMATLPENCH